MGCNYYAHIIPTKERKRELFDAIEGNDFSLVNKLTNEMYGNLNLDWETKDLSGGIVHLGKASAGWKFLWNPNIYLVRHGHSIKEKTGPNSYSYKWVDDPNTATYLYPLTREGIRAFVMREDVEIYDEYGEKQDEEEFLDMAFNWTTWQDKEGWDSASYEKEYPDRFKYKNTGEYINLLKAEGFEFTSYSCSDFYSDGLRFATNIEFS